MCSNPVWPRYRPLAGRGERILKLCGAAPPPPARPGQQGSEEINYTWAEQSRGCGCGIEWCGIQCRGRDAVWRDGGSRRWTLRLWLAVVAGREVAGLLRRSCHRGGGSDSILPECQNSRNVVAAARPAQRSGGGMRRISNIRNICTHCSALHSHCTTHPPSLL